MAIALLCPARSAAMAVQPPLKQVVIYKTHFDIGYTDLAKNVVNLYRTGMIEKTLNVIDANRGLPKQQQFVWTIPGWPMEQMLWSGQDPQRKAKIDRPSGTAISSSMPCRSARTPRRWKLKTSFAACTIRATLPADMACRCRAARKRPTCRRRRWLMPTICRHAGIDFLHIGVNDATTAPKTPLLFWWEGPDGSRLLTMLTNTYGTWRDPPRDWPYTVWPAILLTYDNLGPPGPDTVKKDLGFLCTKISRREGPGRPTVGLLRRSDAGRTRSSAGRARRYAGLLDSWSGQFSRWLPDNCESPALVARHRVFGHANAAWGVKTEDPRQALAAAYQQSLLWSEHTWGLAEHQLQLCERRCDYQGHSRAADRPSNACWRHGRNIWIMLASGTNALGEALRRPVDCFGKARPGDWKTGGGLQLTSLAARRPCGH